METKEQKQFYVIVNGQRVEVTEEVYRAYVRPVRTQQRAELRNWRCVLKAEKYGLVRCKKDCNKCPYAMQGNAPTGNETSLETLRESGYDAPSLLDMESDLIDREERVEKVERLHEAIKQLNERQQYLIAEFYFNGKTHTEISRALGIDRTSVTKAIARALPDFTKTFYYSYMEEFVNWFRENPDTPIAEYTVTYTGKYSTFTRHYTFRYNPETVKMPVFDVNLDKTEMPDLSLYSLQHSIT